MNEPSVGAKSPQASAATTGKVDAPPGALGRPVAPGGDKGRHNALQALADLWCDLPAAVWYFDDAAPEVTADPMVVADTLRKRAWRERCVRVSERPCIEQHLPCLHADQGRCMADVLVPMYEGGGAATWRTATLRVVCEPSKGQWGVLALGSVAVRELGWAVRTLHQQHRLSGNADGGVTRLGDLLPATGGELRMLLATPWVRRREGPASGGSRLDPAGLLQGEVVRNVLDRARRLTTLCSADPRWQLLGAEFARSADPAWLGQQVQVLGDELRPCTLPAVTSRGNGGSFSFNAWEGHLDLHVSPTGHRWLALLKVLGIGQASDKGYGVVEIMARAAD